MLVEIFRLILMVNARSSRSITLTSWLIWWYFSVFSHKKKFKKMETAEVIRASLKQGQWVTSIDIKDAYLHVPMHQKAQRYLRFQTKQGVFQFVSLPFGIATAPLEFTILAKEVKALARSRGIYIHQ